MPSDELTTNDLKSIRTVLQNQLKARQEEARKFEKLLNENREAYLEAVELLRCFFKRAIINDAYHTLSLI